MRDAKHPDHRMRWYGDRLKTLINEFPAHGPSRVARKLGDDVEGVLWAATFFGVRAKQPQPDNVFGLTEREMRVLRGCATGAPARQVAQEFGQSVNTVNSHIANIFRKMGVHTMVAATLKAERAGLLAGVLPVTVHRWVQADHSPAPQAETQTAPEAP